MRDKFDRRINYMRMSITDRCNLRCRYCMPDGIKDILPMSELLSYEELLEIAETAAELGISRFKVTGGEPLVRRDAVEFIASLKAVPGVEQVTLTSNGILLPGKVHRLRAAGLDCVNISLDSLREDRYRAITGFPKLPEVLRAIEECIEAGLRVKINSVLQAGVNEDELADLAELACRYPLDVRFIEMMPIGYGRDIPPVYNEEIRDRLKKYYGELLEDKREHGNGPASYVYIPGFQGSIGFISAMHGKFCSSCNRLRLSSVGKLKPCLCFGDTIDLMPVLRRDNSTPGSRRPEIRAAIKSAVMAKPGEHRFESLGEITEDKEMIRIGG